MRRAERKDIILCVEEVRSSRSSSASQRLCISIPSYRAGNIPITYMYTLELSSPNVLPVKDDNPCIDSLGVIIKSLTILLKSQKLTRKEKNNKIKKNLNK